MLVVIGTGKTKVEMRLKAGTMAQISVGREKRFFPITKKKNWQKKLLDVSMLLLPTREISDALRKKKPF